MMNELQVQYDKIVLLSDIHYGLKGGGDNTLSYLGWLDRTDAYFKEFFLPMVDKIKGQGFNPCLVICGDFFDNRVSIRLDIINRAIDLMTEISKNIDVFITVGNHDTYRTDTNSVNSVKLLKMEHVSVIEEPMVLNFEKLGLKAELIPWIQDKKELTKIIKNSESNILLVHADLNGAKYPNGMKVTDGVETRGFNGQHIFSGHIHLRQELKKITYIGSPYEIDRSDMGNKKGVYVIGKENDETTVSFFENDFSPRYLNYSLKEINEMNDEQKMVLKNNFVSVRYTQDERVPAQEFERTMDKIGASDIRMVYVDTTPKLTADEEAKMKELPKTTSDDYAIREYINLLVGLTDEEKSFIIKKHEEYAERFKDTGK